MGICHRARRIAIYSHDAMGIGHVRRNLVVARALGGEDDAAGHGPTSTLLISGVCEAGSFELPPGVDWLTLPALRKDPGGGGYRSRRLPLPGEDVLSLRSAIIEGALRAYDPDVLIVDKLPRGVGRELDGALRMLRARGRTRCVLGLRDVLDDPATVRRDWARDDGEAAVEAYYDAIWVYGSPRVYDPVAEYDLPPHVVAKLRYTGYFDAAGAGAGTSSAAPAPDGRRDPLAGLHLSPGPFALCMVGGGEDGGALAEAFARAPLPRGMNAVLVTGPFMPPDVRARLAYEAEGQPRLRVVGFSASPEQLLRRASRVVAMGGYNTIWEILSHEKPALIAPRCSPRQEQRIRAERLRDLGLLDLLYPEPATPGAIGAWLARDVPRRPRARELVDMGGLARLPHLLAELLARPPGGPHTIFDQRVAAASLPGEEA